jgi:hypothetical protein
MTYFDILLEDIEEIQAIDVYLLLNIPPAFSLQAHKHIF